MKSILLNTVQKTSDNYKKVYALISDKDYQLVMQYKWFAEKNRTTRSGETKFYASSRINGKQVRMHNLIMGSKGIDHKDGNGLNNQRSNLRISTHQQNIINIGKSKGTTSKYKGVCRYIPDKWQAGIVHNGKRIALGVFKNEDDAGLAYNKMAKKLHGKFAYLNTITQ